MGVGLAKRDVADALKIIFVDPEGCCIMGVSLIAGHIGLRGGITVIYCCLNFGWLGAPGWVPCSQQVHLSERGTSSL